MHPRPSPETDPDDGWERRFVADPEKAREATELYTALGYEVRVQTADPQGEDPACSDCQVYIRRAYVTIYTRKKPAEQRPG